MSKVKKVFKGVKKVAGGLGIPLVDALTKPPKMPDPAPVQEAPTTEDPAVEEARRKEIVATLNARGRASTMLTGGLGDTSAASIGRRTLLGG